MFDREKAYELLKKSNFTVSFSKAIETPLSDEIVDKDIDLVEAPKTENISAKSKRNKKKFLYEHKTGMEVMPIRKGNPVLQEWELEVPSITPVAHDFSATDELVDVWVYTMKLPCPRHPTSIESVTAQVYALKEECPKPLNIYYCKSCCKYYINSEQYHEFARKYGLPVFRLRTKVTQGESLQYEDWQKESLLHILGYNVNGTDNLSSYERRTILKYAIDSKTMEKSAVVAFLENLIYRNQGKVNFQNALQKWKADLQYVREYKITEQRGVQAVFKKR